MNRYERESGSYSGEAQLPGLEINRQSVEALESYLRKSLEGAQNHQHGERPTKSSLILSIEDSLGTETLQSIRDFALNGFPDTINCVVFRGELSHDFNDLFNFTVQIAVEREYSRMNVACRGPQCRELAVGFIAGVQRVLEPHRSLTSPILHSQFPLRAALVIVGLVLLSTISNALKISERLAVGFLGGGLVSWWAAGTLWFWAKAKPYTVFETARNKRRAAWLAYAFLSPCRH